MIEIAIDASSPKPSIKPAPPMRKIVLHFDCRSLPARILHSARPADSEPQGRVYDAYVVAFSKTASSGHEDLKSPQLILGRSPLKK